MRLATSKSCHRCPYDKSPPRRTNRPTSSLRPCHNKSPRDFSDQSPATRCSRCRGRAKARAMFDPHRYSATRHPPPLPPRCSQVFPDDKRCSSSCHRCWSDQCTSTQHFLSPAMFAPLYFARAPERAPVLLAWARRCGIETKRSSACAGKAGRAAGASFSNPFCAGPA